MLNPDLNRTPLTRTRRATSLVVALMIALAVSGYAISAQTFSSFAGSVSDQLGGLVPNATLVLVHKTSGSKYEVKSNSVGLFEFVGLPAGEYSLESYVPGFKSTQTTLVIGGQSIRRDLALELGTLEETISVVGRRRVAQLNGSDRLVPVKAPGDRSFLDHVWQRKPAAAQLASAAVSECTPASPGGIGGNIRVPRKTRDVRPIYPEAAEFAGIEGLVDIGAVIGPEGQITSLRINDAPGGLLGAAALEAIGQWEFTPTLLNCRAMDVQMSVHVRFALEP